MIISMDGLRGWLSRPSLQCLICFLYRGLGKTVGKTDKLSKPRNSTAFVPWRRGEGSLAQRALRILTRKVSHVSG